MTAPGSHARPNAGAIHSSRHREGDRGAGASAGPDQTTSEHSPHATGLLARNDLHRCKVGREKIPTTLRGGQVKTRRQPNPRERPHTPKGQGGAANSGRRRPLARKPKAAKPITAPPRAHRKGATRRRPMEPQAHRGKTEGNQLSARVAASMSKGQDPAGRLENLPKATKTARARPRKSRKGGDEPTRNSDVESGNERRSPRPPTTPVGHPPKAHPGGSKVSRSIAKRGGTGRASRQSRSRVLPW
jgi:hypothetical protein